MSGIVDMIFETLNLDVDWLKIDIFHRQTQEDCTKQTTVTIKSQQSCFSLELTSNSIVVDK